jgi:hypothetical protein
MREQRRRERLKRAGERVKREREWREREWREKKAMLVRKERGATFFFATKTMRKIRENAQCTPFLSLSVSLCLCLSTHVRVGCISPCFWIGLIDVDTSMQFLLNVPNYWGLIIRKKKKKRDNLFFVSRKQENDWPRTRAFLPTDLQWMFVDL